MNKNVMALAVAGVLAAPAAFAQSSNVQLYGRANLGFDNYAATGASNTGSVQAAPGSPVVNGVPLASGYCNNGTSACNFNSRNRIFDNSSRVGVRGTEDLGNGLKAIFQIESGVNVDSGNALGQAGVTNASAGTWASRDSFVGIDSNFGRLTFGRQSIFWSNGEIEQAGANYINTSIPMNNAVSAMGIVTTPVARSSNTVQYTTPTFYGFNVTGSYSPQGEAAAPVTGLFASQQVNKNREIWGVTGRFNYGPFVAQVDWATQQHVQAATTFNGTGGSTAVTVAALNGAPIYQGQDASATAWKLGAGWKYMPGAIISAIWITAENKGVPGRCRTGDAFLFGGICGTNPATGQPQALVSGGGLWANNDTLKQNTWMVNWEHTFGNIALIAQYGQGGNVSGSSYNLTDTQSSAYLIGARYLLSKRTWIYASFAQIQNKTNSYADFNGGQITSATPVGVAQGFGQGTQSTSGLGSFSAGADPTIWALGMFHAF